MGRVIGCVILGVMLATACAPIGGDRVEVYRTGPAEMLKLRAGPGLGFKVLMALPDGTLLNRHDCVVELGQKWCEVSLVEGPGVTGYVSADYIRTP